MRYVLICISTLLIVNWAGCVPPFDTPDEGADTFLAMDVTKFGGPEAIPVFGHAVTTEANLVALPEDLVQSAPEEITLTLAATELEPSLDAGHVNPSSKDGAFHCTITFHLAPPGEDACASDLTVGPYEMSLSNGKVRIAKKAIVLPAAAAELVRGGKFEICAETSADFDGALSVSQLIIEFGKLNPGDTRVEICHVPPGNPAVRHTIIIAASALQAHLARGSYLGPCLDEVEPLRLTSVCSDDPDTQRRWRIHNPNSFAVDVGWEVYGTERTGTLTAEPADSFFETVTVPGANTTIIRWTDHNGVIRSTAKASSSLQCPPDEPDSDGDGVPDASDDCPDTPNGEDVNESGCSCSQLDSDADGVDDRDDACPETPPGVAVDETGCPLEVDTDSDGDGVLDASDACPDTLPGEVVDESGCSCSQLDEDNDGVDDCNDLCPGTPSGVTVDAYGCPIMTADAGEDIVLSEVGPVTLQGSASGGAPPYSFTWSAAGWDGSSEQTPTVMPRETTVYTLTVTDWSFPPQIATATVTVTIAANPEARYTIENLGSLSARNSYAAGLNDLGDVVGYYYSDEWARRAFLFSGGTLIDLGTLGGDSSEAADVNSHRQIVGQSLTDAGEWHAFIWDAANGMRDLGTLGGSSSEAYAINDHGQVAGFSETPSGDAQAFIYADGVMSPVPGTEAHAGSGAFDINDSGHAVGILLTQDGASVGFKHDGELTLLGWPMLTASEAWLINNQGLVAGHSWGSGQYRSFLYADGLAVDLGVLSDFERTYAWGLSDAGQVVGSAISMSTGLSHAFIYRSGQLHDLNDLLVPDHGWEYLTSAAGVNSHGQIAGYGKINGQFRPFLLTPME